MKNHYTRINMTQMVSTHEDQYDSCDANGDNRGTNQEEISDKEESSDNEPYEDDGMFSDKDYEGFAFVHNL